MTSTSKIEQILRHVTDMVSVYIQAMQFKQRMNYGHCLSITSLSTMMLHKLGVPCAPACGTAHFRILDKDKDDGSQPTHLSFIYDSNNPELQSPEHGLMSEKNRLVECHCWSIVQINGQMWIYDPSALAVPFLCEAMLNCKYECSKSPTSLLRVMPLDQIGDDQVYLPDVDATRRMWMHCEDAYNEAMEDIADLIRSGKVDMPKTLNLVLVEKDTK